MSGLPSGFGVKHLNNWKVKAKTSSGTRNQLQMIQEDISKDICCQSTYLETVSDTLSEYWPEGIGSYSASTI